tara:strand:- start:1155 stop:2174 length:1020 start_codon:yes stop_codon:yes gene_type:complete
MKIPEVIKPFLRDSFHYFGSYIDPRLYKNWKGTAIILGYHRIIPDQEFDKVYGPYRNLSISVNRFRDQMHFIKENYDVVSMDEIYKNLIEGNSAFKVAVTFDDGYRDNLLHALPVLEEFKIPATIYCVSRFPEGDTRAWWFDLWDEIQQREKLEINEIGKIKQFPCSSLKEQIQSYKNLSNILIFSTPNKIWVRLNELKGGKPMREYPHLFLNWDEIKQLSENKLITIGAHTHSHPNMHLCSEIELRDEIFNCKNLLESKLGVEVKHFAYPFGGKGQVSEREIEIVQKTGFSTAVTTYSKPINKTNFFTLPRQFPHQKTLRNHLENRLNGWNHIFQIQA